MLKYSDLKKMTNTALKRDTQEASYAEQTAAAEKSTYLAGVNAWLDERKKYNTAKREGTAYDDSIMKVMEAQVKMSPHYKDYEGEINKAIEEEAESDFIKTFNDFLGWKQGDYTARLDKEGHGKAEIESAEKWRAIEENPYYEKYRDRILPIIGEVNANEKKKDELAGVLGVERGELKAAMDALGLGAVKKTGAQLYGELKELYAARDAAAGDDEEVARINKAIDLRQKYMDGSRNEFYAGAIKDDIRSLEVQIRGKDMELQSWANDPAARRRIEGEKAELEKQLDQARGMETAYLSADLAGMDEEEIKGKIAVLESEQRKSDEGGSIKTYNELSAINDPDEYNRRVQQYKSELGSETDADEELTRLKKLLKASEGFKVLAQYDELDMSRVEEMKKETPEGLSAEDKATYSVIAGQTGPEDAARTYLKLNIGENPNEEDAAAYRAQIAAETDYSYLTQAEKDKYIAIVNAYGGEKGREYLDALKETVNARKGKEIYDSIGTDAGKVLYGFVAGLDQFGGGLRQIFSDEALPTSAAQFAASEIQQEFTKNEKEFGRYAAQFTQTIGNMAPTIAASIILSKALGPAGAGLSAELAANIAGTASAAMLGASAGGNAYGEALRQGYSVDQAAAYGVLVGASEAGLQRVLGGISALGGEGLGTMMTSFSKNAAGALGKISTRIAGSPFATWAVRIAGNSISEGIEEYLQEVLEPAFRNFALNESNDIEFFNEQALEAGIMGALTGALFEGVGSIRENHAYAQLGRQTIARGGEFSTAAIVEVAAESELETAALAKLMKEGKVRGIDNEAFAIGQIVAEIAESENAEAIWRKIDAEQKSRANERSAERQNEALRAAGIDPTGISAQDIKARTEAEAQRAAEEIERAKERKAAGETRTENGTPAGENKAYSLRMFEDGTRFVDVDVDQEQFDGLTEKEMRKKAEQIIREKFAGRIIGIDNRAFVNNTSAREYAYPSARLKNSDITEAKMRASTEIANLMDAGRNFRTAADGADGHTHPNATGDFQYFDVLFKVGENYYEGTINIEQNEKGLRFKDLTKIKDVTQDTLRSVGQSPKSQFLRTSSMDNIHGNTEVSQEKIFSKTVEDAFGTAGMNEGGVLHFDKEGNVRAELTAEQLNRDAVLKMMAAYGGMKIAVHDTMTENGYFDRTTNTLHLAEDAENGVLNVAAHEMTHFIQKWAGTEYANLKNFVIDFYEREGGRGAFDAQVKEAMLQAKRSGIKGAELNRYQAADEVVAKTCELLLDGRSTELIKEIAEAHPGVAEQAISFLREVTGKIKDLLSSTRTGTAQAEYLRRSAEDFERARDLWIDAYKRAGENYREVGQDVEVNERLNETGGNREQYSIRNNSKGLYVEYDRNVIFDSDPKKWGKNITDYINDEIRHGRDVTVYTENGVALTITKDTAGKAAFRNYVLLKNGQKRLMTDAEYAVKLRAEAHIDELGRVSRGKGTQAYDKKGHSFTREGFNYRQAYFRDVNGDYYLITMSVGKNGKIQTIYNVGKIEEAVFPTEAAQRPDRSKTETRNTASVNNIPANTEVSQENSENSQNKVNSLRENRRSGEDENEGPRTREERQRAERARSDAEKAYLDAVEKRDAVGKEHKLKAKDKAVARMIADGRIMAVPALQKSKEAGIRAYAAEYTNVMNARAALKAVDPTNELVVSTEAAMTAEADAAEISKRIAGREWDVQQRIDRFLKDFEPTEAEERAAKDVAFHARDINTLDDTVYKPAVAEYAELLKERRTVQNERKELRRTMQQKYIARAVEITKNADTWKDAIPFINDINTMQRNVRRWLKGDADGQRAFMQLFSDISHNEAEKTRYINSMTDRIGALKLDAVESALVQAVGEGEESGGLSIDVIPKGIEHNGHDLRARIEEGVKVFRECYAQLYEDTQNALARAGFKPMGQIENYFPHIGDGSDMLTKALKQFGTDVTEGRIMASDISGKIEEISAMASGKDFNAEAFKQSFREALGIEAILGDQLNTSITGETETFKPGKQWSAHILKRYGKDSNYNALKGFDAYIQAIGNVIYHTDDIKTVREVANSLRSMFAPETVREQIKALNEAVDENGEPLSDEVKAARMDEIMKKASAVPNEGIIKSLEEYANLLAGKKSRYDRAAEYSLSRKGMLMLGNAMSFISRNMIGFNPATAVTNILPVGQVWGEVSNAAFGQAVKETIKNIATKDGFSDRSDFITNRSGTERVWLTKWDKFQNASFWMMGVVDDFATQIVTRAYYNDALSKGMSDTDAMSYADTRAAELMGDRSLGAQPNIFSSKTLKLFTQFQFENFNFYMHYFKDMPQEYRRMSAGGAALSMTKSMVGLYLANGLLRMLRGRGGTLDPIDIMLKAARMGSDDEKDDFWEIFKEIGGDVLEEMPVIGTMLGGGRFPIQTPLSGWDSWDQFVQRMTSWETEGQVKRNIEDIIDVAAYLNPAGGYSQLKKTAKGIIADIEGGVYQESSGNVKLKYEANDPWQYIQNAIFGTSSTKAARDYYTGIDTAEPLEAIIDSLTGDGYIDAWEKEGGMKALSAKETQGYRECKLYDFDRREFILLATELDVMSDDEKAAYIRQMYPDKDDWLFDTFIMTEKLEEDYDKVAGAVGVADWYMLHKGIMNGAYKDTDAEEKIQWIKEKGLPEETLIYNEVLTKQEKEDLDELRAAGVNVSAEEFWSLKHTENAVDQYGDAIAGSKKAAQAAAINGMNLQYDKAEALGKAVGIDDLYKEYTAADTSEKDKIMSVAYGAGLSDIDAKKLYKNISSGSEKSRIKAIAENKDINVKTKVKLLDFVFDDGRKKEIYEIGKNAGAIDERFLAAYYAFVQHEGGMNKDETKEFLYKSGIGVDGMNVIYLMERTDKKEYNERLDRLLSKTTYSAGKIAEIRKELAR